MLEKIQMTPSELLEIMRLASRAAFRTRKPSAAFGLKPDLQNIRALARIQALIKQSPRRRHTQTKRKYLRPVHRPSSVPFQMAQRINAQGSQNLSVSTCRVEEPVFFSPYSPDEPDISCADNMILL
jgi:hypothetical protein